jgi:hypothetical protein
VKAEEDMMGSSTAEVWRKLYSSSAYSGVSNAYKSLHVPIHSKELGAV